MGGLITVPVPTDGSSAKPVGKQNSTLQPYMSRSVSSPGAERVGHPLVGYYHGALLTHHAAHRPKRLHGASHIVDALEGGRQIVAALQRGSEASRAWKVARSATPALSAF